MDTDYILTPHINGSSPEFHQNTTSMSNGPYNGFHHYQNTSQISYPHVGTNSTLRKKKMATNFENSNYVTQNSFPNINGANPGQPYSRDPSNMVSKLNTTGDTNVSMQEESDEQQEVIEVQILHQRENWGEGTTAANMNSDLEYAGVMSSESFRQQQHQSNVLVNDHVDKWRLEPGARLIQKIRKNAGPFTAGFISLLAFMSPILMAGLPKLGALEMKSQQLACGVECDGALVSMAFKLFILAIGTWGVFIKSPRSTLPRVRVYRALVCAFMTVFIVSFWLFYISHLTNESEIVNYKSLVSFAVHLVDALLFVHYLAIILIELRHQQPLFYIKIVRSPDGESRGFNIGQMSVQRAAAWILDKYYSEFPYYNPYLDRVTLPKQKKGLKVYDSDGQSGIHDGASTAVGSSSRFGSHNERFYEEAEYEKKLKKRRARLITATEEAFAHIRRIENNKSMHEKSTMDPFESAQAIFPSISRPLQKFLRVTRQQPHHSVESIIKHLSRCLSYDISPRAFLEKYLVTRPVLQNEQELRETQSWSLISERLLYRDIESGTLFQLRQGDVSLMCQVFRLPHFNIAEEIIDPLSNRFVLKINSETSV